jgi:hypothetical protein
MDTVQAKPHFSLPALIAIAAAIGSFFSGAGWGLFLAGVAIFFGVIGFLVAMAPGIRGGIVSFFSVIAGAIGIVMAIIKLIL